MIREAITYRDIEIEEVIDILPSLKSYFNWMNKNTNVISTWDRDWVIDNLIECIEKDGLACAAIKDEQIKGVTIFDKTRLMFDKESTGLEYCWHVDDNLTPREKVNVLTEFIGLAESWAKKNKIKKLLISAEKRNPITKKLLKIGFFETETYYQKEIK